MLNKLTGYLKQNEQKEILGVASTETEDRHGDVIKQDGWELAQFKKNPVMLASHDHHAFPIGKITSIRVQDKKLTFRAIFSEATQQAREASQLVKEGILNTFSVGFIAREFDEKDKSKITKSELLEISLVSVPANPEAIVVAKGLKDNAIAKQLIKEWLLDETLDKKVKSLESIPEKGKDKLPPKSDEDKEKEEKVIGRDINLKLIQKTTGYLQEICRELKTEGGAKK